jgi:uncharacterized protein (UPF0335 family)
MPSKPETCSKTKWNKANAAEKKRIEAEYINNLAAKKKTLSESQKNLFGVEDEEKINPRKSRSTSLFSKPSTSSITSNIDDSPLQKPSQLRGHRPLRSPSPARMAAAMDVKGMDYVSTIIASQKWKDVMKDVTNMMTLLEHRGFNAQHMRRVIKALFTERAEGNKEKFSNDLALMAAMFFIRGNNPSKFSVDNTDSKGVDLVTKMKNRYDLWVPKKDAGKKIGKDTVSLARVCLAFPDSSAMVATMVAKKMGESLETGFDWMRWLECTSLGCFLRNESINEGEERTLLKAWLARKRDISSRYSKDKKPQKEEEILKFAMAGEVWPWSILSSIMASAGMDIDSIPRAVEVLAETWCTEIPEAGDPISAVDYA